MDSERSLREHGLRVGELEAGPTGSIADVDGVAVGHVTVVRDEPDPPEGRGVGRSGVTAVVPGPVERLWAEPLSAGTAVLNGAGELTSSVEINEWGLLSTPVYLTATMSVGRVFDGAVSTAIASDPQLGVEHVVIPTVGECDDSWLNDARVVQVEAEDAGRAVADAASSPDVLEGAVGAGTGMICCDWKGGIGSSSRITEEGHVVGVLVLANYGVRSDLRVDGVPVGRLLESPDGRRRDPAGSCIVVVATDAQLGSAQLTRIARRGGLGLGRTGSVAHHGSGEIMIALSTTARAVRGEARPQGVAESALDSLFQATVEATEEAVMNALWRAETTTGRMGRVIERLPHEPVLELLTEHGRLRG
jgi:D-aminopeptidase